jgi:ComF family protein
MSTIARSLVESLTQTLLPPTCCLCGERGQFPALDLCAGCVTLLPLNAPDDGAFPSCESNVVRTLVPFQYAYPVDQLIRALKFRGERVYARVLGTLLAQSVLALRQTAPALIVPIPLHPLRYRERGFNQAHEIARYAAALLRIPVGTQYVRRHVSTSEQSGLSLAQRRKNVRGAFEVVRPIGAGRVALVDDVLTTGSTAGAAAQALTDAGVRHVEIWAVARVRLD